MLQDSLAGRKGQNKYSYFFLNFKKPTGWRKQVGCLDQPSNVKTSTEFFSKIKTCFFPQKRTNYWTRSPSGGGTRRLHSHRAGRWCKDLKDNAVSQTYSQNVHFFFINYYFLCQVGGWRLLRRLRLRREPEDLPPGQERAVVHRPIAAKGGGLEKRDFFLKKTVIINYFSWQTRWML